MIFAHTHTYRVEMLAQHSLPHVDQQQCEHGNYLFSATLMDNDCSTLVGQQSHIGNFDGSATHDIPICETHDGASNNSSIAISDEVKAQDADSPNTNFEHTHADQLSQCKTLTQCERTNIRSLASLNSSQTQVPQRVCAQRAPPAQRAGGQGAKRAGAKAVKRTEQHGTESKLSSDDATTFRALPATANYLTQDRAAICFGNGKFANHLLFQIAIPMGG